MNVSGINKTITLRMDEGEARILSEVLQTACARFITGTERRFVLGLRNQIDAARGAIQEPITYAIGHPDGEGCVGMYGGPSTNLDELLQQQGSKIGDQLWQFSGTNDEIIYTWTEHGWCSYPPRDE